MEKINGKALVIDDDVGIKRQIVDLLFRNNYDVRSYGVEEIS